MRLIAKFSLLAINMLCYQILFFLHLVNLFCDYFHVLINFNGDWLACSCLGIYLINIYIYISSCYASLYIEYTSTFVQKKIQTIHPRIGIIPQYSNWAWRKFKSTLRKLKWQSTVVTTETQALGTRLRTKTDKTTQYRKSKRWATFTQPQYWGEPSWSRRVSRSSFSQAIRSVGNQMP